MLLAACLLSFITAMPSLAQTLTTTKVKVDWKKNKFEITGEIPYPAKPDTDPDYQGSASVSIAGIPILETDNVFDLALKGKKGNKWKYKDKHPEPGYLKEFKVEWKQEAYLKYKVKGYFEGVASSATPATVAYHVTFEETGGSVVFDAADTIGDDEDWDKFNDRKWEYSGPEEPLIACSEEDENILLDPAFVDEGGALEICGEASGGKSKKFADCIEEETGISESCADAYGDYLKCASKEDLAEACEDACTSSDDPEACDECKNNSECDNNFRDSSGFYYPAPTLSQGTYIKHTSNCHNDSICHETFSGYNLSPWETKEFRVYCSFKNDDFRMQPTGAHVNGRKGDTTCTIDFCVGDCIFSNTIGYYSKSCTNWSFTSGDTVYPGVTCEKFK